MSYIKNIFQYLRHIFQNLSQKHKEYKVKREDKKIGRAKFLYNIVLWWLNLLVCIIFLSFPADYGGETHNEIWYTITGFLMLLGLCALPFLLYYRISLIAKRCQGFGISKNRAILFSLPLFPIFLLFVDRKDIIRKKTSKIYEKVSKYVGKKYRSLKLFLTKSNIAIICISIFCMSVIGLLFSINRNIKKQSLFHNENICRGYSDSIEKELLRITRNLFKSKHGKDISNENQLKEEMSPYGVFYSNKHNTCLVYFRHDGDILMLPYDELIMHNSKLSRNNILSRGDGYYAWVCNYPSFCFILHDLSRGDFFNNVISPVIGYDDEVLYYNVYEKDQSKYVDNSDRYHDFRDTIHKLKQI